MVSGQGNKIDDAVIAGMLVVYSTKTDSRLLAFLFRPYANYLPTGRIRLT